MEQLLMPATRTLGHLDDQVGATHLHSSEEMQVTDLSLASAQSEPTHVSFRVERPEQSKQYKQFMALPSHERHKVEPDKWPYEISGAIRRAKWNAIENGAQGNFQCTGFRINPSELPFKVEWEDDEAETVPRKYLVKKLIPQTGVVLLSGVSKSGKSLIGTDLAACIATGIPFFGEKVTRGGTLILSSEPFGTLPDRLRAFRRGKLRYEPGPWPSKFPIAFAPFDNISATNMDAIIARCKELNDEMLDDHNVPLRLIIIDTLVAPSGMEDENSSEATALMKLLKRMASELNVVVMPVVTLGKSVENDMRGSSAFEASADAILTVQCTKDQYGESRALFLTKSKEEETGYGRTFELDKYSLGPDEDGDETASCFVIFGDEPDRRPFETKKNPTPKRRKNLLAALDNVAVGGESTSDDGWAPLAAVREQFAVIEGKALSDAFRKQCERTEIEAEEAGKIEISGPRGDRKMRRKPFAQSNSGQWTGTSP